jgi:hypothetical protein
MEQATQKEGEKLKIQILKNKNCLQEKIIVMISSFKFSSSNNILGRKSKKYQTLARAVERLAIIGMFSWKIYGGFPIKSECVPR